jgi:hypothetical protein
VATDRSLGGRDPVAELVRRFAALEAELRELLARAGSPGLKADLLARVNALARTIAELRPIVARFAQQAVRAQFTASAGAANTTLARAGLLEVRGFRPFELRAAQALVTRVHRHLDSVAEALTRGLVLGTPRAAVDKLLEGLGKDGALVRLDGGELKVLTPAGQFWSPEPYARMVARTGIADARRAGFRERYLANGVDVVEVVANGTAHDVCARWEGELLSLTGATEGLPTVAEAEEDGLFHPNCTHRYVVAVDHVQPGVEVTAAAALDDEGGPRRGILALAPRDPRTPPPTVGGLASRAPAGSRTPSPRV